MPESGSIHAQEAARPAPARRIHHGWGGQAPFQGARRNTGSDGAISGWAIRRKMRTQEPCGAFLRHRVQCVQVLEECVSQCQAWVAERVWCMRFMRELPKRRLETCLNGSLELWGERFC